MPQRIIFHVDMDAFFAAVEVHDRLGLDGLFSTRRAVWPTATIRKPF